MFSFFAPSSTTFYRKGSEVVTRRCSVKKQFLKLSQNSRENTCIGAPTQVFPANLAEFLRTPFFITPSQTASRGVTHSCPVFI